jgi:two-component system, OmpR family, KDP operon response regulator KdpE
MATVLCIDDDAAVLGMYRALLEGRGYRVLTAPDGATGIAISRKHSVDAVVLDFNMTGMDGNEVAAVLTKEQPTVPVVICSGSADDLPESLKWFADALVQKGDASGALLAAIEKVIGFSTATNRSPSPTTVGTKEQLSA